MIKKRLLQWLLKNYYLGITEDDFVDLKKLSEPQAENYCLMAQEVFENDTFKTELSRLRYKQEQYIARKAAGMEDLLFGRSALYIIDMLEKRFESLATRAVLENPDRKREPSTPDISGE